MTAAELINKLRSTAGALARQGNHDARDLMNDAADLIEEMDERIAIMEEGSAVNIQPGVNVDLWPALAKISGGESRITMDDALKGDAL